MKRAPWFPVDANFQDDAQILGLTVEAELLFIRSLAHAKRLGLDGTVSNVHLRRLCDKFAGADDARAQELVDAALWIDDGPDGFRISAWTSWNAPSDIRSDSGLDSSDRGKLANHSRWKHPGALETCLKCYPENPLADPSDADSDPFGIRSESDPSPHPIPRLDKKETETERRDPPQSTVTPRGDFVEIVSGGVANDLLLRIGYVDETAAPDLVGYVDRALTRGWPLTELQDAAAHVRDMSPDEIDTTPMRVLTGILRKRANSDPAIANGSKPFKHPPNSYYESAADQWARVEARIADEKAENTTAKGEQ